MKATVKSPSGDEWKNILLEYRKKNFKVKVDRDSYALGAGEIYLSITNNGYQWTSISIHKREIPKVIKALRAAMKTLILILLIATSTAT